MPDDALRVSSELDRISTFFPILRDLGLRWASTRPWHGRTIAMHLHLTTLTATLVRELTLGGGRWVLAAANPATTDLGVARYLRDLGVEVHSGGGARDGLHAMVAARPHLFADVGFPLGEALARAGASPAGGVEITRSGVTRMRELGPLPFPVMNINDGRLKPAIENRHGVGEGLWQSFTQLTGMHLAGRRVCVVGYGTVGSGVAAYARSGGAQVEVWETDPVRRLVAHYDGYATLRGPQELRRAQVIVTATGFKSTLNLDMLRAARDGAVIINAGHGGDEIDIDGLRSGASAVDQVSPRVVRYTLEGRTLVVLGDGHPLNIVMNSGSQEPVMLHFAVLGLALEWFTRNSPPPGEVLLPRTIEEEASLAALRALG